MSFRRLLIGPGRSVLHVGFPVVFAVAVLTAASTASILASNSGGGVYFPLDALAVAAAASAVYAARYRAVVVCLAIGVAAFAGSQVGFHAVNGDEAVLLVLARFVRDLEAATFGVIFGAVGAAVGGVVGGALRFYREMSGA